MSCRDRAASLKDWLPATALVAFFALVGCNTRPHAPALGNSPIYQNDREGFRFVAPQGWSEAARSDIPAGKLSKERLLVAYRRFSDGKAAHLEVSLADLPEATDLAAFLAEPSFGVSSWQSKAAPESFEVGGVSARRFAFTGRSGKIEWMKEVVAFRRGERVCFFTGVFAPTDESSRDQIRRVIASIIWK